MILNIDTSSGTALVNIAENGKVLFECSNAFQNDHAAFLLPAIKELLQKAGITSKQLTAVAVVYGPGSYTGVRVGLSAAKGLVYALQLPLITLNGLEVMCEGILSDEAQAANAALFCPMIDARRMEVFTAVYDKNRAIVTEAQAMLLDTGSFNEILLKNKVLFFGSGADKWKQICSSENALFTTEQNKSLAMSTLSFAKWKAAEWADLAYVEPLYLKEFFTANKNVK